MRVTDVQIDMDKFGSSYLADRPAIGGGGGEGLKVDRTYKLYYGGAQKRPDANYSRVIRLG